MTISEPAMSVRSLTKNFGEFAAVDGVSFDVAAGEVFGFLGPNGAGKTTTIKMLLGLVRPTSGEARIFGQPVGPHAPALLRRVGAMVEAPAFYPFMSARDNLRLLGITAGTSDAAVSAALARVGLREAGGRPFGRYSVGMKQRLALAAVLLRDPELVILDEPATGLDPAGQHAVLELVRELAAEGRTVFFSSHALHEVEQVCTRVAVMNRGRLIAMESVENLVGGHAIHIAVPDAKRARAVLAALPSVRAVRFEGDALIVDADPGEASSLNRALAAAGLFASEIRPAHRSLEAAYLQITAPREAA